MGIRFVAYLVVFSVCFSADFIDTKPFYWKDDRLGLDVDGVSMADVWYRYATICQKNLMVSSDIKGKVRAQLDPMRCDDLLPFLQDATGVIIEWKHGVGIVKKKKKVPRGTIIELRYQRAEDAIGLLKGYVKKQQYIILGPQRLWLAESPQQQNVWKTLIDAFDVPDEHLEWHILMAQVSHHRARQMGLELSPLSWRLMDQKIEPILMTLHHLEKKGEAQIIVRHHAPMMRNHPLRFEAIEEIPYEVHDGWGQRGVSFKKVGLKLLMTPKTHYEQKHFFDVQLDWSQVNQSHMKQIPGVDALLLDSRIELNLNQPIGLMNTVQNRKNKHQHCPGFFKHFKHPPRWLCHRNRDTQQQQWWILMWLESPVGQKSRHKEKGLDLRKNKSD